MIYLSHFCLNSTMAIAGAYLGNRTGNLPFRTAVAGGLIGAAVSACAYRIFNKGGAELVIRDGSEFLYFYHQTRSFETSCLLYASCKVLHIVSDAIICSEARADYSRALCFLDLKIRNKYLFASQGLVSLLTYITSHIFQVFQFYRTSGISTPAKIFLYLGLIGPQNSNRLTPIFCSCLLLLGYRKLDGEWNPDRFRTITLLTAIHFLAYTISLTSDLLLSLRVDDKSFNQRQKEFKNIDEIQKKFKYIDEIQNEILGEEGNGP